MSRSNAEQETIVATGRTSRKRELNELFIKNAKAETTRLLFRDTKSEGLVLRVSPTGTKTFAVMMRDGEGKPQTYTLGWYPDLSLKEARAKADQMRHEVKYEGALTPTSHVPEVENEVISRRALLADVQPIFAVTRKGWRPRGPNSSPGNAYSTILSVFAPLLDWDVQSLAETDLAKVVNAHKRARPTERKTSANGQVSRAMSYLAPVLDWAAGRGRFGKIGAGRIPQIGTPDLRKVSDPSDADPTILGKREQVLQVSEIAAIWPLLQYPPPPELCRQNIGADDDYGPVALRFILLTLARLNEVTETCWDDFDFENGVWHRAVKFAPRVVDEILSHTEPLAREGVSKSAGHYMVATRILTDIEDPRVIALEKLAQAGVRLRKGRRGSDKQEKDEGCERTGLHRGAPRNAEHQVSLGQNTTLDASARGGEAYALVTSSSAWPERVLGLAGRTPGETATPRRGPVSPDVPRPGTICDGVRQSSCPLNRPDRP